MGLADFVFPAFLFIVGLSIPYAIRSRRKKGNSSREIFFHIVERTIALLVMGVFLVNSESYAGDAPLPKQLWVILMIIAFFLIWLDYKNPARLIVKVLKGIGILLLIALALVYRNNDTIGIAAMGTHWWGILGLIGWAYFISSCVFLFSYGNVFVQVSAFIFLISFSAASFLGWLVPLNPIREYIWIAENGAIPAFSVAGVITSICYKSLNIQKWQFWIVMIIFLIVGIFFGLTTRPIWGISKIYVTPSWVGICTGLSIIGFLILVYITDIKQKTG